MTDQRTKSVECPICEGYGSFTENRYRCMDCNGSGTVYQPMTEEEIEADDRENDEAIAAEIEAERKADYDRWLHDGYDREHDR